MRKFKILSLRVAILLVVGLASVAAPAGAQGSPAVSIADTSVGEAGGSMVFTITLDVAQGHTVTVEYSTANLTATAGHDYTATTGSVQFTPGQTSKEVSVPVLTDSIDENDETFALFVSSVTGANIGDGQGDGTILDDDPEPSLSISDLTITEGDSGQTEGTLTVSLSSVSGKIVGVDYATSDGTAGSADYATRTGHLAFNPGTTSKTIPVTVLGDTNDESNETFTYTLSAVTNASLPDPQATVTITDDDGAATPTLSISDEVVTEGNSGQQTATLDVTLSSAAQSQVTVMFQTADGTATVSGNDYSQHSGQLTFAAGETLKTINATVLGDTVDESDEQFVYNLSGASGATVADPQGSVTITDDDGTSGVQVSINDVTVTEGDSGTTPATLTISLSAASPDVIQVSYETSDGTAEFNDVDYYSAFGSLAFNPGVTSRTVTVDIVGDNEGEGDEFLSVDLTSATGATIADNEGRITITDDDGGGVSEDSVLNVSVGLGRKVKVSGDLAPPHPGDSVLIKLYRKSGGSFQLIGIKDPAMGAEVTNDQGDQASPFAAKFRRPQSGKCKVKVSWPGDADTERASKRVTFSC